MLWKLYNADRVFMSLLGVPKSFLGLSVTFINAISTIFLNIKLED